MRTTRILLGLWPSLVGALAGCDAPVFANEQRFEIIAGERTPSGGMCFPIGDWRAGETAAGGGSADGDLQFEYDASEDALTVDISSQGELLEHRKYSERLLRSGKREQFTITTNAGRTYELNYWGSDECELPTPK